MTYQKLRHVRFDKETEEKYQKILTKLWEDKNLPGKPKDSEGHRLVVHELYTMMFNAPDIDLSTAKV